MTTTIRPLIAGNWKMHGTSESLSELRAIAVGLSSDLGSGFDALICVPATLISRAHDILSGEILSLGGQDCHTLDTGAYTGDVSAPMIKDAGASFVIVGHSERREYHHESDEIVRKKTEAAHRANLVAVVCVGEKLEERENGIALSVVESQLAGSLPDKISDSDTIVAYEPVWAIGTGKIPTIADVEEMHGFIRNVLVKRYGENANQIRILYGGSVKPDNAATLLAVDNVNGALVGGASLKAGDFLAICNAGRK